MSLAAPTARQPAAPTAAQLAATQLPAPTAMPLLPIMSVRPNQMGYFAGAPSNFFSLSPRRDYSRGTSTVTKPSQASPKRDENRPVHAQGLESLRLT